MEVLLVCSFAPPRLLSGSVFGCVTGFGNIQVVDWQFCNNWGASPNVVEWGCLLVSSTTIYILTAPFQQLEKKARNGMGVLQGSAIPAETDSIPSSQPFMSRLVLWDWLLGCAMNCHQPPRKLSRLMQNSSVNPFRSSSPIQTFGVRSKWRMKSV